MSTFNHGAVEVGSAPVLVCTVSTERASLHIQNAGERPVFIGGPDVAVSGPRRGFEVAPGASRMLFTAESDAVDLYGVSPDSTTVVFLT